MTRRLTLLAIVCGLLLSPAPADERVEDAVRRGLDRLAALQGRDGAFEKGNQYMIAITGLSGLAFVAHGDTTTRGRYAEQVRDCAEFLLHCAESRTPTPGLISRQGEDRPMYGHGYSALFLAELYGQNGDEELNGRIHDVLKAASEMTRRSQSIDGGWYYEPESNTDEGSVTITQVQALRAMRNAGIQVDVSMIDRATRYVYRSQDADGGIRYTVRSGNATPILTAAGAAVLLGAGDYDSPQLQRAFRYMDREFLARRSFSVGGAWDHFHYGNFYAAQVYFQRGGEEWERYYPPLREYLLSTQNANGGWDSPYGEAYGTSLTLFLLQLPYHYLPLTER